MKKVQEFWLLPQFLTFMMIYTQVAANYVAMVPSGQIFDRLSRMHYVDAIN